MRKFMLRWLWAWALLALGLAYLLGHWGGYWHITRWAEPLPKRATEEPGEAKKVEEVPPVHGDVSDDTRKAMEKHIEAQKKARRPPH